MGEEKKKILIIRLSALGDIVRVLPALAALRRAEPEAHIGWVVEERFADFIAGHPDLDEIIILPRKDWSRRAKNPLRLPGAAVAAVRFFRALRKKNYDIAIDFHGNLRSGIVTRLSGAPRRIGFDKPRAKEFSHRFYTDRFAPPLGAHRLMWNMLLLSVLGIDGSRVEWRLPPLEEERRLARGFLDGLGSGGPFTVIHPGVSGFGSYKQWPAERFAEVARLLVETRGGAVVLTHGPGEEELCRRIARDSGERAFVAPKMNLRQLTALLREVDLFVSADTGPMHIAAAAGTPVVAIFGPKDEEFYGPLGSWSEAVSADVPCRPCRKRHCDDPICITEVSVGMVMNAIKKIPAHL